jgi:hypothetical protein
MGESSRYQHWVPTPAEVRSALIEQSPVSPFKAPWYSLPSPKNIEVFEEGDELTVPNLLPGLRGSLSELSSTAVNS